MTDDRLYIADCGIVAPIGCGKDAVARALLSNPVRGMQPQRTLLDGTAVRVGEVRVPLPEVPADLRALDSRNNRMTLLALDEIADAVTAARARYGANRIAVVMGSSTSGIQAGEDAFEACLADGAWPADFDYAQQELSSLATFAAARFGLTGPAYTIATACSSSTKVFASAQRLIHAGMADAALVGGTDTLCRMTLNGFASLELLAKDCCNPFSKNRDGINIGEGAAAFLIERTPAAIELAGVGESSDAHHMTAPEPSGRWSQAAMRQALEQARLEPGDLAYINLHGTGTMLNDAMEANGVAGLFGDAVPCSSTKGMTGHMLGASGGCEAAFLWLTLHPAYNPDGLLPPHLWDGEPDPALPALQMVTPGMRMAPRKRLAMLSNSFGFSGSNASVILARA